MHDKVDVFGIVIGGFVGLVLGVLGVWGFDTWMINIPSLYDFIVILDLMVALGLIIGGMYALHAQHLILGMALFIAGFILLAFFFRWYIPLWADGYWISWSWWFEW